jgi:hypothetical protein
VHEALVIGVHDVIGEIDEQLCKAALRGGVVAEDRGEGRVAEGLREALAEGFAGAGVVAESVVY